MNILHVIHRYSPAIGGAEKYMQDLSEQFVREGHAVTVYTTNALDIDYFFDSSRGSPVDAPAFQRMNGVGVHRFKIVHFALRKPVLRALSYLPSWQSKCLFHPYQMLVPGLFRKTWQPHSIDIVHASASPFTSLLYMAYLIAKKNNVPFVLTPFLHIGEEGDTEIRREHLQPHQVKLWHRADAIIVCTKAEQKIVLDHGVPPDRIHRIGVGINPGQASGGDGGRFRQRFNIGQGERIIAHIARWDVNKGTIQLHEALNILLQKNQNVRCVLLGAPTPAFTSYWQTVPEPLKKHCLLLERADDDLKNDLLAAMDVFVMPSCVESFGIVYLESWLNRKPVIGADMPAVREIIADEQDGLLVKFGDAATLARKISQLLDDSSLARRMGEAGYLKTTTHYTWEKLFPRFNSLYHNLIVTSRNTVSNR